MDLNQLQASSRIIFEGVAGSQAYGTQTPASDIDLHGIFIVPLVERLALTPPPSEISDERQNTKYYELRKFFELAATCNPNLIELLWLPEDCIRICRPPMPAILSARHLFISRLAAQTFTGYAYAQIKKARGQHKMVNNPQPETRPEKLDFCWFIPLRDAKTGALPCRPVQITAAGVDLRRCHAAALEHTSHVYRLYDYGDQASGVFRNGMLVCESIPLADEATRFLGLLVYREFEWDRALREWNQYWDWVKNRNAARWVSQEKGELDYDPKNMMHCLRLLLSGANILRHGEPCVRFHGELRQYLRDVRAGRFTYAEVTARVEELMAEVKELEPISPLPPRPDPAAIERLFAQAATGA